VRRSEFDRAAAHEFGERSAALVADLFLFDLGNRTAEQALKDGEPARAVWLALCAEMDVPEERRHGAGRLEPRR